jgi:hypothetical protein
MLDRIMIAMTAQIIYLCLGIGFLLISSLIYLKGPVTSTTLISGLIFIPLVTAVLLSVTVMPSAIFSSLIYAVGGFFHQRVAILTAVIGGSLLLYLALNGKFPEDWKYRLTIFDISCLLALYLCSWMITLWFLPKAKIMANI